MRKNLDTVVSVALVSTLACWIGSVFGWVASLFYAVILAIALITWIGYAVYDTGRRSADKEVD